MGESVGDWGRLRGRVFVISADSGSVKFSRSPTA